MTRAIPIVLVLIAAIVVAGFAMSSRSPVAPPSPAVSTAPSAPPAEPAAKLPASTWPSAAAVRRSFDARIRARQLTSPTASGDAFADAGALAHLATIDVEAARRACSIVAAMRSEQRAADKDASPAVAHARRDLAEARIAEFLSGEELARVVRLLEPDAPVAAR